MFNVDKFQARKYREAAIEDGGESGGSGEELQEEVKGEAPKDEPKEVSKDESKAADPKDESSDSKTSDREAELLRESMQRKKALREANERMEGLEKQLSQWDGLNLNDVKTLLKEREEAETRKLEEQGQFEKVKEQMRDAHQKEMETLHSQINDLQEQLSGRDSRIEDLSIGNAFGQSKFITEKLTLPPSKARALFAQHFDYDEKGQIVGFDKPRGVADRAQLVDGSGDPLSFDQALSKIVDADPDKDALYRSQAKPGAGSGTDPKAKDTGSPMDNVGIGRDRIKAAIDSGNLAPAKGLDLPT